MIYEPQEDSYLMQAAVRKYARGNVLEIGTGSGIQAATAAAKKNVKSVLGVDINKKAVAYCKKNVGTVGGKVKFIVSDLFSKVPKKKYDVMIFNPPYLPEDEREPEEAALATSGGKKGYEITERFLASVGEYLADDGMVLLLFSTLTRKEKVEEFIQDNMMVFEEVGRQKIPFEKLYVYRIIKTKIRRALEKKGVTAIEPLAKGHRGLIYVGKMGRKKVAVKIQRDDIGASGTVDNEAKVLRVLNKEGIGPVLLFSGKDHFAYEFVEGEFVFDHFEHASKTRMLKVIKDVYGQMFKLDTFKMNKEEMHHPVKHILVDKKGNSVLIDFERCKKRLKRHNVTQFTQFVVGGRMKVYLDRAGVKLDKKKMLKLAGEYSKDYSKERFEKLLKEIKQK